MIVILHFNQYYKYPKLMYRGHLKPYLYFTLYFWRIHFKIADFSEINKIKE